MTTNYVTREELLTIIEKMNENTKSYIDTMAKQIGDRVERAIRESITQTRKESDERIMKFEDEQNNRLLKALGRYERLTEKHERIFNHVKDELDKES